MCLIKTINSTYLQEQDWMLLLYCFSIDTISRILSCHFMSMGHYFYKINAKWREGLMWKLIHCISPIQVSAHTLGAVLNTRTHTHTFLQRLLGSNWGFGALLKGNSLWVLRVEENAVHLLPWPTFPVVLRIEPATFRVQLRLYTLGHNCLYDVVIYIWQIQYCVLLFTDPYSLDLDLCI